MRHPEWGLGFLQRCERGKGFMRWGFLECGGRGKHGMGHPGVEQGSQEIMGDADILELTADKLRAYTNGFSQDNFLGNTQFGKLYRGKIPRASTEAEAQEVTVKIWQDPTFYLVDENDKKSRLADELHFLKHPSVKTRGNLVKLIGYSRKGEPLGVVYDLNPLDTLHNLITKDDFSWLQRIKAALGFADLLAFLHGCNHIPFMVRNIDAEHIMIDQVCNPILLEVGMLSESFTGFHVIFLCFLVGFQPEFGMLNGGIFGDTTEIESGPWYILGSLGCVDVHLASVGKRVVDKVRGYETAVDVWAKKEYKPKKSFFKRKERFSLVHNSLQEESTYDISDGYKITELAMSCVEYFPGRRPTMQKVSEDLQALHVVQSNAEAIGIKPDVAAKKPKLGSRFSIRW
ncbi:hypothetical protein RJ639_006096 [Escallonia herrerae]|uniref:Protein kinase domain-containing protein n=1 Tax=Escallonia herrerae TaxID=1293975 RepID=A0AA88W359_9ASTE|nr:hypothetical protein RJ639_006096 [Escallonia herrerae]